LEEYIDDIDNLKVYNHRPATCSLWPLGRQHDNQYHRHAVPTRSVLGHHLDAESDAKTDTSLSEIQDVDLPSQRRDLP
jgi:hypothetical protein